jgi:archaellum component FlaC
MEDSVTTDMEKSLNEMREDIERKEEYQGQLSGLKERWEQFEPDSKELEKLYENLTFYQNNSQNSTEEIIKLTNQLKNKIKKHKTKIDQGKY